MIPPDEQEPTAPSPFLTQQLPSGRLEITNRLFIVVFSICSLLFGIFGVVLVFSREEGTEFVYDYSDECLTGTCVIHLNVTSDLNHPIAVMYELTGFYQNHLHSMTSRSDSQLLGEYVRFDEMAACKPFRSVDDDPSPNKWILPCGLQANTMFNDTFEIKGLRPLVNPPHPETGIAVTPLSIMYQAGDKWLEAKEEDLAEPLDVRFRLWMDTAAFPKFRRIWGKASEEHGKLAAQVLEVAVQSHYNVSSFGGRKALVIAEESTFPKSARLLGTLYLCAAGVMILSATFALIVNRRQSRID